MPRILVADDNSNIQKMVALALQGEGLEVIGVGNGEAAVRKVREINPDLVLADIFMPVRSGYEVCDFVKNDSRYMQTPVVLLVGAFDPLDEQEAQRVRADGVLKKPFVPPEPLVNMVKTLLVKYASERLVAVGVPETSAASSAVPLAPAASNATPAVIAAKPVAAPAIPELRFEEPEDEFPVAPASVTVNDANSPVAFGSLLETAELPALDENDPIVTSARDPNLGDPGFWASAAKSKEAVSDLDEPMEHSWGKSKSLPGMDESAVLSPLEPLELDREAARTRSLEILEDEKEEESLLGAPSLPSLEMPAFEHESLLEEEPAKAEEVSALKAEWPVAKAESKVPSLKADLTAPATVPEELEISSAPVIEWPLQEDSLSLPEPEQVSPLTAAAVLSSLPSLKIDAIEPATVTAGIGADAELEPPVGSEKPKVSGAPDPELATPAEIAAERQALARFEPEIELPSPSIDARAALEEERITASWLSSVEGASAPAKIVKAPEPLKASEEPIPSQAVSTAEPVAVLSGTAKSLLAATEDSAASSFKEAGVSIAPSPEVIEAVVTRIVERMQPKVLDMVTREILRPVVEALVRREIEKK